VTAEQIHLVRELRGEVCQCGKKKRAGRTFCYFHYSVLPRSLQLALYKRLGEGYEAAYREALAFITGEAK
jgi:hypothetical protein